MNKILNFLKQLKENNNKEWMDAKKIAVMYWVKAIIKRFENLVTFIKIFR